MVIFEARVFNILAYGLNMYDSIKGDLASNILISIRVLWPQACIIAKYGGSMVIVDIG